VGGPFAKLVGQKVKLGKFTVNPSRVPASRAQVLHPNVHRGRVRAGRGPLTAASEAAGDTHADIDARITGGTGTTQRSAS
jgi:hypothetical protein